MPSGCSIINASKIVFCSKKHINFLKKDAKKSVGHKSVPACFDHPRKALSYTKFAFFGSGFCQKLVRTSSEEQRVQEIEEGAVG